jgi:hypothetical protein
MTLSDIREERIGQVSAIKKNLATAPDIQKDLRNYISRITEPYDKVGLDDSIFDFAELVGYRINNSLLDIAEDLDVKSRHGIKKNKVARLSVGSAFRGYDGEHFPEHEFYGLLGKGVHGTKINDMIEEIRYEKVGREKGHIGGRNRMALLSEEERSELGQIGGLIGGRATIETHGDQMRNGGRATIETHGDQMRNGGRAKALAQGFHVWSLEEIVDIHNFREESIGKGRYKNKPSLDYVTAKMNEKYGENWSTSKVNDAYHSNKDKLPEEEE